MQQHARPYGFTLIELLVVIAIIALLAAIMFPVFAKAREKARTVTCINNQKQIALTTLIWVQDHDEGFPNEDTFWTDVPFDRNILLCPTLGTTAPMPYLYAHALSDTALGQIRDTSTAVLSAEARHAATVAVPGSPPAVPDLIATKANVYYSILDLDYRHNNHAVVSYVDGHVEARGTNAGDGLRAEYYCYPTPDRSLYMNFVVQAGLPVIKVDPCINFDNYTPSTPFPTPTGQQHDFCVRWTGYFRPLYTDNYTIYIAADDGLRFYITDVLNGNNVVATELWQDQPEAEKYVFLKLEADVRYPVKFEYYENDSGPAAARLRWASSLQTKGPIPTTCLFSQ